MKYKLIIILLLVTLSCRNNNNIQNNIISVNRDEIEPNDSLEYSQFIDTSTSINAGFQSDEDIDYYQIKPTNASVMNLSVYANKLDINLTLMSSSNSNVININTKYIENYRGFIELKDFMFYDDSYFLKLSSDKDGKYDLRFEFKNDYFPSNEIEPNNNINAANIINYPNELFYGYFLYNDFYSNNFNIDENIKPYIKNSDITDIDFYEIRNDTDINTSINIILEYSKDIDMLLFDENYNYIKKGINKLSTSFKSGSKYYIALVCFGSKSIIERYTLHYEFN
ncbi:hypothetical protein [Brachyspira murdochii]|uniref:Lipoprotein n=1 Tax=Brachyspira murdochii TaxID=84378 RepID=A0ABX5B6Y9_9SPIR|nr:hypothetical protein [Brachyspira murdochii]PPS22860.1 hypothetical protein DJ52_02440 [Brachyspira murdochii]